MLLAKTLLPHSSCWAAVRKCCSSMASGGTGAPLGRGSDGLTEGGTGLSDSAGSAHSISISSLGPRRGELCRGSVRGRQLACVTRIESGSVCAAQICGTGFSAAPSTFLILENPQWDMAPPGKLTDSEDVAACQCLDLLDISEACSHDLSRQHPTGQVRPTAFSPQSAHWFQPRCSRRAYATPRPSCTLVGKPLAL
jgi:hypothetical protein